MNDLELMLDDGEQLKPAPPVEVVDDSKALTVIKQDKAISQQLSKKELVANKAARGLVDTILGTEPGSPQFNKQLDNIFTLGASEFERSASLSSKILDDQIQQSGKNSPQAKVTTDLAELRQQVTELDPSRADLKGAKKLLRWLPGGNKIDNYFNKYASAREHIDAIEQSLNAGSDQLMRYSASLESDMETMHSIMGKLSEYDLILSMLDGMIQEAITDAERTGDQEKAKRLKADALFAVRQRRDDVVTQATVAYQAYLSYGATKKNNDMLVRGIERARTTTLFALEASTVLAQALGVQERILVQMQGLRDSTSEIVSGMAKKFGEQTLAIQQQAAQSAVSPEALEDAFNSIYKALDDTDTFRAEAADNFLVTIGSLQKQLDKGKQRIEMQRKQ